jgi:four helix bundle protein
MASEECDTKPMVRGYRDLLVWQKGMVLARRIYDVTRGFPSEEKFGLISQMRRAAVSVPSNIAEGQARKSTLEFVQFISNAEGSVAELDTQLQLSMDLGFCNAAQATEVFELLSELKRMLNALRRTLAKR